MSSSVKIRTPEQRKKYANFYKKGKFYGYPTCCIDNFMKNLMPVSRERNIKYKQNITVSNNTGFIPCNEHTKQILEKNIVLADLIGSRICFTPFPNDSGASIDPDRIAMRFKMVMSELRRNIVPIYCVMSNYD